MWSIGSAASDVPYAAPQSWATYNGNNQVNATTQAPAGFQYDTNGRVTSDGGNAYTYDAEGRITAVSQVGGLFRTTLYIYDAEGRRVAKAFPTGIVPAVVTPDFLHSGAAVSTQYILGKDGEEVSQLDGSGDWLQSNAYYDGQLLATITPDDTLFSLNDWLGTKRVTVGASLCGTAYTQFPFGDGLVANPLVVNGATLTACEELDGHHFTGKERDNESGNDYFGARYYQSNMGRWMSPDWSSTPSAVPYATLTDPQSLNLYLYGRDNPVLVRDYDGHCPPCIVVAGIAAAAAVVWAGHEAYKAWHHFMSSYQKNQDATMNLVLTAANPNGNPNADLDKAQQNLQRSNIDLFSSGADAAEKSVAAGEAAVTGGDAAAAGAFSAADGEAAAAGAADTLTDPANAVDEFSGAMNDGQKSALESTINQSLPDAPQPQLEQNQTPNANQSGSSGGADCVDGKC